MCQNIARKRQQKEQEDKIDAMAQSPTKLMHEVTQPYSLNPKPPTLSPGFRIQSSEFSVWGSGFRVQGSGFGVQGLVAQSLTTLMQEV